MKLPSGFSAVIVAAFLALGAGPVRAQLVGHGGPVKTVAVSSDGQSVLSGGFDTSAILWSQQTESAQQVFGRSAVHRGRLQGDLDLVFVIFFHLGSQKAVPRASRSRSRPR